MKNFFMYYLWKKRKEGKIYKTSNYNSTLNIDPLFNLSLPISERISSSNILFTTNYDKKYILKCISFYENKRNEKGIREIINPYECEKQRILSRRAFEIWEEKEDIYLEEISYIFRSIIGSEVIDDIIKEFKKIFKNGELDPLFDSEADKALYELRYFYIINLLSMIFQRDYSAIIYRLMKNNLISTYICSLREEICFTPDVSLRKTYQNQNDFNNCAKCFKLVYEFLLDYLDKK